MSVFRNVSKKFICFNQLGNISKMPKRSAESEGGNKTPKKQKVTKDSDKRTQMKESATESKYVFFYGKNSPFSQFHAARFVVDGITYNCMEQYMHHQKAVRSNYKKHRSLSAITLCTGGSGFVLFAQLITPDKLQRPRSAVALYDSRSGSMQFAVGLDLKAMTFKDEAIAKQILAAKNPIEHKKLGRKVSNFDKDVWNKLSVEIVTKGNEEKFSQNEDLKKALFDTGDKILAEASPRDRIWGIGLGASNPKAQDSKNWRGKNKLGYALTEVREKLKKKSDKILTKD